MKITDLFFTPLNDIKKMGFSKTIGSFNDLFDDMEEDIESSKIKKADVGDALLMTSKEKRLSFLNNYFIYKRFIVLMLLKKKYIIPQNKIFRKR